jgi:secreted trypsin-like serine protease
MVRFIALFFLYVLQERRVDGTCGAATQRLFDGQSLVLEHQWPWLAYIRSSDSSIGGAFACGGSLIDVCDNSDSDMVLTAAHCISSYNNDTQTLDHFAANNTVVWLGMHNMSIENEPNRIKMQAKSLWIHPGYTGNNPLMNHDIAVIQLDEPVRLHFGGPIESVCLPSASAPPVDKKCYVAGWGGYVNDVLQKTPKMACHQVFSEDQCAKMYERNGGIEDALAYELADATLCSKPKYQKQFLEAGDFGGPLMCVHNDGFWTQYGVIEGGFKNDKGETILNKHTKIFPYMSWINDLIKQNSFSRQASCT